MVLGWSSSAGPDGIYLQSNYGVPISPQEFSWMGSLTTLGAGAMCIPIGILADLIGRKNSMLLMVVPFTVGWLCVICANSVLLFYIGRFITGVASGAFCVAAPMYTTEISESSIRGSLGSYFQLLLTVGILLSYIFGSFVDMFVLSIISAMAPLVFFVIFMFMPETPLYYLMKGNEDAAKKSLTKLRGARYNVDSELQKQREIMEENKRNKVSFSTMIKSKVTIKGFVIGYGLMIFQQFCGVNVVIFYTTEIFEKAGSDIKPHICVIIIGVMQTVSVFVSTLVVDRLGRRILLLASAIFLFLSTFALGVYFYLQDIKSDVESFTWLPLVCLSVFTIMFSMGFGPLPWMMMGEIFAPEVKSVAASSAGLLNWLMAFIVTKFFADLKLSLGMGGVFWLFSGLSAIAIFFVYILVPETKGKSLDEILRDLSN
ncbi:Facilitated trehalose transporter Tret1 [Dufourea novaeangliae]|uniref:Facilitated trehalose transporter Tret1 n=2 Tax=Dufourea novaeangliae TaxID=178035 RepID=A0A154PBY8_DUFNO|nr:Facilitated trehalose transporter Tret1 [Dufourea novaeangliae]